MFTVFISVGEAGGTLAECLDAANAIEHHPSTSADTEKQKAPTARLQRMEQRRTRYPSRGLSEPEQYRIGGSVSFSNYSTSTLSIRRCVTFTANSLPSRLPLSMITMLKHIRSKNLISSGVTKSRPLQQGICLGSLHHCHGRTRRSSQIYSLAGTRLLYNQRGMY